MHLPNSQINIQVRAMQAQEKARAAAEAQADRDRQQQELIETQEAQIAELKATTQRLHLERLNDQRQIAWLDSEQSGLLEQYERLDQMLKRFEQLRIEDMEKLRLKDEELQKLNQSMIELEANSAAPGEGCHGPSPAALHEFAAEFNYYNLATHNKSHWLHAEYTRNGGIASNWNGPTSSARNQAANLLETVAPPEVTNKVLSLLDDLVAHMTSLRTGLGLNEAYQDPSQDRQATPWEAADRAVKANLKGIENTVNIQLNDIDAHINDPDFAADLVHRTQTFYQMQLEHAKGISPGSTQLVKDTDTLEVKYKKATALNVVAVKLATARECIQRHSEVLQSVVRLSQPQDQRCCLICMCTEDDADTELSMRFDCCNAFRVCTECNANASRDTYTEYGTPTFRCPCFSHGTDTVPV